MRKTSTVPYSQGTRRPFLGVPSHLCCSFQLSDNTQKYQRYLELISRPRLVDIVFTIPRRRW